MKVIVAGSRKIEDESLVYDAIKDSGFVFTELVSGGARGVDILGETLANFNGIPVKRFPANWKLFSKKAGPIRNKKMALYADALVAIWDGYSSGTANMIEEMRKLNKPVYVVNLSREANKQSDQ